MLKRQLMKISLHIFGALVIGMILTTSSIARGQESKPDSVETTVYKDPLKKPEIWKKLTIDPKNDGLWKAYFGKDLFELDKEEGSNYREWKGELVHTLKAKQEAAREKLLAKYRTEKSYVAQSPYLQKLMSNISSNFMLIEDFFSEEFSRVGAEYTFYEDKYPKGDFNKIEWIEQNEKKLIELTTDKKDKKEEEDKS